jgi:hypothetical protein
MRTFVPLLAAITLTGSACVMDGTTEGWLEGGDPPGDEPVVQDDCPESPASDLFGAALCVCEDFQDIGNLLVGRAVEGDHAIAAINGMVTFVNNTHIRGDLIAYGGLGAAANLAVDADALSAGNVDFAGNFHVGGDLSVGGNLSGAGFLSVDGLLRLGGDDLVLGFVQAGGYGEYVAPAGPPCACDDDEIFDVVAEVEAARTDNDNDVAGLPSDIASIGWTRVRLTSGRYYLADIATIGGTVLDIDGNVAIYVDGDLRTVGAEWIHLRQGATLDLYVAGAVRTIGHVSFGDKSDPSAFRLYIGGADTPTLSVGNEQFNGEIYAPRAMVRYIGNTNIRGSLFARALEGTGNLTICYAAPHDPDDDCDPPEVDPDPDPDPEDPEDPPIVL